MPTTTTDARAAPELGDLGLPVSKLRGLAPRVRAALKVHRLTTCGQLLRAAGGAGDRDRLARYALALLVLVVGLGVPWLVVKVLWLWKRRRHDWGPY